MTPCSTLFVKDTMNYFDLNVERIDEICYLYTCYNDDVYEIIMFVT